MKNDEEEAGAQIRRSRVSSSGLIVADRIVIHEGC